MIRVRICEDSAVYCIRRGLRGVEVIDACTNKRIHRSCVSSGPSELTCMRVSVAPDVN